MSLSFVVVYPVATVACLVSAGWSLSRSRIESKKDLARLRESPAATQQPTQAQSPAQRRRAKRLAKYQQRRQAASPLTIMTQKENWPVALSGVSFGLSLVAYASPAPVLVGATVVTVLVAAVPLFQRSLRKLIIAKQLDADGQTALLVFGGAVFQQWIFSSVLLFIVSFTEKMISLSEDDTRSELRDFFGAQQNRAWVRLADGTEVEVDVGELAEGDTVVVAAGDVIPIDGTVSGGHAMVDQQVLFGEQDPVTRGEGELVYAGTSVVGGRLEIQVREAGAATVASQVTELLENTADYRTALQRRSDIEQRRNVPLVVLGAGLVWPFLGSTAAMAFLVSCPGVVFHFTSPFATLSALQRAVRRGILIKDGRALEVLPDVDLVLFDKTGTLTLEVPEIGSVFAVDGWNADHLLQLAAAAEGRQTHPIAQAIRARADGVGVDVPLSDEAYAMGRGVSTKVGELHVAVGNRKLFEDLEIGVDVAVATQVEQWEAVGASAILIAVDGNTVGALEIRHQLRPGAAHCVRALRERGIACEIISGDSKAATRHIAERLGIERWHAEQLPDQKLALVEAHREAGRKVCFIGDGINDAVALKASHISLSMQGASTAAVDQAGVILLNPHLHHVLELLEIADHFRLSNRRGLGFAYSMPSFGIIAALFFRASPLLALLFQDVAFYGALASALSPPRHSLGSSLPAPEQSEPQKSLEHP